MLPLDQSCRSVAALQWAASEAEDEAKAFSDLGGLQMALEVKCKLVLMVLWP